MVELDIFPLKNGQVFLGLVTVLREVGLEKGDDRCGELFLGRVIYEVAQKRVDSDLHF